MLLSHLAPGARAIALAGMRPAARAKAQATLDTGAAREVRHAVIAAWLAWHAALALPSGRQRGPRITKCPARHAPGSHTFARRGGVSAGAVRTHGEPAPYAGASGLPARARRRR